MRLMAQRPDAMVLDVMMPRLDGLEVCRRMRAGGDDLPILVLTARDAVSDRVSGLDAGADDYLPKPFALEELLARLRALLRRRSPDDIAAAAMGASKPLVFGDLSLDPDTREVRRGDRPISLTRTEFSLLELLLALSAPGAHARPDPRAGLGLRLPDHRQRPRGLHRLPASQDRGRRRAAPDPHRPRRGVRTARHAPRDGHPPHPAQPPRRLHRSFRDSSTGFRSAPASAILAATVAAVVVVIVSAAAFFVVRATCWRRSTPTSCSAPPPPRRAASIRACSPRSPRSSSARPTSNWRFFFADALAYRGRRRRRRPSVADELAVARGEERPVGAHRVAPRGGLPGGRGARGPWTRRSSWPSASTRPSRCSPGLAITLPVVGAIGVLLAALAGVAVARTGLRPVDRLTAATERIATTGDLRPIPVDGTDELARLTRSFNAMLGALAGVAGAAAAARRGRRARVAHPVDVDAHQPGTARRRQPAGRSRTAASPSARRSSRTSRRRSRSCRRWSATSSSWPATMRRPSCTSRSNSPT